MNKLLLTLDHEIYGIPSKMVFHNQHDMELWLNNQDKLTKVEVTDDTVSIEVNHGWTCEGKFEWVGSYL